jgi:hypothetical protein
MSIVESTWLLIATVGAYLAVLGVPGIAIGLLCGLRGWALAGLTPLLGYAALGLAGPWLHLAGLPFTVLTALGSVAVLVVLVAAACLAARRFSGVSTRPPELPAWSRRAHVAVGCCVALAFVLSVLVIVLAAEGDLDGVLQRWDPVFHANGIRYIAETGDGGLYGVSSVNRYGPEGSLFYPNAYHLAGSLVYLLTGSSVPLVMNAMTLPLAGVFALSMAALVRECGGRAVLAGCTAIVSAVVASGVYETISNGLLPFALSVALTPLGPLAVHRFVTRPGVGTGIVLGLACAGMLAVHSSALFAVVLFSLPLLVYRWLTSRGTLWPDLRRLALVAVPTVVLTLPHLLGALDQASGSYGYRPWASDQPLYGALYNLLAFQHARPEPQLLLAGLLVVGVLGYRRLGSLRWVGWAAVLFGVLWLLVASYGGVDWVAAISRPWWNDRPRMIALAVIPLCILAAHGLAQGQRWLAGLATRRLGSSPDSGRPHRVRLAAGVLVVVVFGAASLGFYASGNVRTVARAYHNGDADTRATLPVSPGEVEAMHVMGRLAAPGERVMNDRNDGSVWLYAVAGVKSVAGHYDEHVPPRDAALLADHFREYRTNPRVRAAVARLGIRHVFVGDGSRFPRVPADRGLVDLEDLDFLRPVYRNADAVIYKLNP